MTTLPAGKSFWQDLPKPFFALAPMEEVTDTVFRRVIADCGRPEVFFTEFTSCEGIQSVGQAKVIHRLRYHRQERPIVAQIWGITPKNYYDTARLIAELGFDGIDINMGCPVKKVIKQGACSALIKNPTLAKEIVLATMEGSGGLPVSIKTRIGFGSIMTEDWCGFLLRECRPKVLTVHGRTVKEESKVPNHWEEIAKVVQIRESIHSDTLIVGNGDVGSLDQGRELASKYGLDGIMIGRAVFKNPWVFNPNYSQNQQGEIYGLSGLVTAKQRLDLLQKHVDMYLQEWGDQKNFQVLKRFFKIYAQGFAGAGELRARLMECQNRSEVDMVVQNFLAINPE